MKLFGFSKKTDERTGENVNEFLTALIAIAPHRGGGTFEFSSPDGDCIGFLQLIIESWRAVTIHRLWTVQSRQGNGSHILRTVCDLADRHTVEISLKVLPIGRKPHPLTRDQLLAWYERYGFEGTRKKMKRVPISRQQTIRHEQFTSAIS